MPRIRAIFEADDTRGAFDAYYRGAVQLMEQAALRATDKAARQALGDLRGQMRGAGLGRLGNAISSTSDLQKGGRIKRYPNGGFSASGVLFIRSKSPRTIGAIEAYTRGADIRPVRVRPVRGRWLWIATDEIPRVTNRERMTPDLYRKNGFEQKIGPLVQIRSVNGNPLLVARNVGVSAAGKARSAKSLTKAGRARKGQRVKEFVVAFIGIPRTARAARVDVVQIVGRVRDNLPAMWEQEMQRRAK